jgi:hypothetical protein
MNKDQKVRFSHFIEKFPEIDLPITLNIDSHHIFSQQNDPLNAIIIDQFIAPFELEPMDDYTEYIACFRLPNTYDINAVVYWKAGLLTYQYTLLTFDKNGRGIDKKVIAGTFSDGDLLTQSVATIDEDWTIHVVTGQQIGNDENYDASASRAFQLELLPEGTIVESE